MNIYELKSDLNNYSNFNEITRNNSEYFSFEHSNWKPLNIQHEYFFELLPNNNGKKNYQFDISAPYNNYCVFSEKAINVLFSLLEKKGEFFDIITPSKRKKFKAFYPYKNVYSQSIVNFEKSEVIFYKNGSYQVRHPVFNSTVNLHDPLFVVDGIGFSIFVNDEFKQLVEQHDLKGFDFSEIIPIMD